MAEQSVDDNGGAISSDLTLPIVRIYKQVLFMKLLLIQLVDF
ncbi:hypothetical protein [Candidatus Ruthia endofausta]|nr:hypothetical protein [Candidatus Ruthia endofausta]